ARNRGLEGAGRGSPRLVARQRARRPARVSQLLRDRPQQDRRHEPAVRAPDDPPAMALDLRLELPVTGAPHRGVPVEYVDGHEPAEPMLQAWRAAIRSPTACSSAARQWRPRTASRSG